MKIRKDTNGVRIRLLNIPLLWASRPGGFPRGAILPVLALPEVKAGSSALGVEAMGMSCFSANVREKLIEIAQECSCGSG